MPADFGKTNSLAYFDLPILFVAGGTLEVLIKPAEKY
jgi:hypothetical protein